MASYVFLADEALSTFIELHIRGGIEVNSKIIFLISQKIICCDPSLEPSR